MSFYIFYNVWLARLIEECPWRRLLSRSNNWDLFARVTRHFDGGRVTYAQGWHGDDRVCGTNVVKARSENFRFAQSARKDIRSDGFHFVEPRYVIADVFGRWPAKQSPSWFRRRLRPRPWQPRAMCCLGGSIQLVSSRADDTTPELAKWARLWKNPRDVLVGNAHTHTHTQLVCRTH